MAIHKAILIEYTLPYLSDIYPNNNAPKTLNITVKLAIIPKILLFKFLLNSVSDFNIGIKNTNA